MELRRPEAKDKKSILEMIDEFLREDRDTAGLWNFQTGATSYEEWLEANLLQEQGLLGRGVPAIQFLAVDDNGHAIGFLNLRLALDTSLLQKGGHIGYSIRPSERGKGYATSLLWQGIQVANAKNISQILVTCSTQNPASRKVILKNGGILEDIRGDVERYWIKQEVTDE